MQEENSPRLIQVGVNRTNLRNPLSVTANGKWSSSIFTSSGSDTDWVSLNLYALRFKVSSGEVRPRNQAIRIWKRVQ